MPGTGSGPPASGRSMRAGFPPWSWILFSRYSTAMSRPFGSGPARPGGACALERDATSRFPSGRVAGRRRGCQLANRGDGPGPQHRGGTGTEPLARALSAVDAAEYHSVAARARHAAAIAALAEGGYLTAYAQLSQLFDDDGTPMHHQVSYLGIADLAAAAVRAGRHLEARTLVERALGRLDQAHGPAHSLSAARPWQAKLPGMLCAPGSRRGRQPRSSGGLREAPGGWRSWRSQVAVVGFADSAARRYSALMRWASSSWSSRMTMRQAASMGVPWSTSSRARAAMRSW